VDASIAREDEPDEAPWERVFLDEFRERGNVRQACIAATKQGFKVGRTYAFAWKKRRTPFRLAWNEIVETQFDELEYSAYVRATAGVKVPIVYRGHQIKDAKGNPIFKIEYSDRLAEFLLVSRRPAKFARRVERASDGSAPANAPQIDDVDVTPRDRAERLRAAMREIWDATAVDPPAETNGTKNGNGASHEPPWSSTNGTNGASNGHQPNGTA
jgi:hypothetical protein